MTISATLHEPKPSRTLVTDALQEVLAGTYGLYLATHNYHWNVEGARFLQMHILLERQYRELLKAVDAIAQRIRSLGSYALPFEGNDIVEITKMISNPLNKEVDANDRSTRMLHNLVAMTETVVRSCQTAKGEAQDFNDDESEDLMVDQITGHQRTMWMLGSILK